MARFTLLPVLVILTLGCNIAHAALRCYDYDDKDCKVGEDCTEKERTKITECSSEEAVCRTKVNRELN